ncbi:MSHA biogenesis protein MshK [Prevotella intermedia]|uniref:MSHA biogenesis protein MshK n=1 Tax=Prevotella intermedia TaxID=28131 RepID=A0A2A6EGX8_PREIN|nr:MSHA biogenesis protein MshK [Prevotella intermedia]PDP60695.1 MSHA biogenesis protein MshK [Prevotella intermedia]PJI21993.1 MSHA biogenesis protein MshK [Prevotella intermedia]
MLDNIVSLHHFACAKLRRCFAITLKRVADFGIINGKEAE